jgi:hypothetical protein
MMNMQVHIFRANGRVFGFTGDSHGANLPSTYGAWVPFKTLVMEKGGSQAGVNVDECLEDIERYGFHLTDAHVRITDKAV